VLVESIAARLLATNSWIVAPAPGEPGVIVDAGGGLDDRLERALAEHRVTPAAVLITHGHFDHTMSAAELGRTYDVPVYLHTADVWQLDQPWRGVGQPEDVAIPALTTDRPARPDHLIELSGGEDLELGGLIVSVTSVPGHTPGSVVYSVSADGRRVMFTGDFLFAGSIGRMDLPGGDEAAMVESLRASVLTAAPDAAVAPGHGPDSTIAAELASNPFLRDWIQSR
jgi:glyoxylase-like metal-dependent hydrolase (beta-lactamase superfamily II)